MKGFGFKQLRRQEGPSFYLPGFKEPRKRAGKLQDRASTIPENEEEERKVPEIELLISDRRST